MTTLFFLLSILFLFYELNVLTRTRETMNLTSKLKKKDFWKKTELEVLDHEEIKNHREDKARGCFFISANMLYMTWVILGVALAFQWQIFLLLFSNAVVSTVFNRFFSHDSHMQVFYKRLDALIGIVILCWIFMNHFHPGIFPTHLV